MTTASVQFTDDVCRIRITRQPAEYLVTIKRDSSLPPSMMEMDLMIRSAHLVPIQVPIRSWG